MNEEIVMSRTNALGARLIAVAMLAAEPCPSGKFPVIIDNEFGGVIFHEACGHGLEATSVAKNNSVFANRIGEKVASDVVTYIDDGTIANEWAVRRSAKTRVTSAVVAPGSYSSRRALYGWPS